MIRFDNVAKRYATGHEGLSGVNLHLAPGEMAFLTGHSGAGKSTLLKLIGLLERATRGQVWVNGRNLNKLKSRDIPYHRREVGMIFQDHRLLHDRTVFDNIALPLVVAGMGHAEVKRRVRAALDKVSLLKKEKVFPITLSGGEQQRVGIARALVSKTSGAAGRRTDRQSRPRTVARDHGAVSPVQPGRRHPAGCDP